MTQAYGRYENMAVELSEDGGLCLTMDDPATMSATWNVADGDCCYLNAATCPDCGAGMVRQGYCFVCPVCGFGGCGS
jgi:hypothetical protein